MKPGRVSSNIVVPLAKQRDYLRPDQIKLVWRKATHEYTSPIDQLAEEVYQFTEELLTLVHSIQRSIA